MVPSFLGLSDCLHLAVAVLSMVGVLPDDQRDVYESYAGQRPTAQHELRLLVSS